MMPPKHQFNLAEAIGIDRSAEGEHLAIDKDASVLGEAATLRRADRDP